MADHRLQNRRSGRLFYFEAYDQPKIRLPWLIIGFKIKQAPASSILKPMISHGRRIFQLNHTGESFDRIELPSYSLLIFSKQECLLQLLQVHRLSLEVYSWLS